MQPRDEKPHQEQVSGDRDQTVCEMKTNESSEKSAGIRSRSIRPRPTFVPCKIVKNRAFDCDHSGNQIIQAYPGFENRESDQLNADSDQPHRVELQPGTEGSAHERRSSRYRRMLFRTVLMIVMISIPTIATTAATSQSKYICPAIVTIGF